MASPNECREWKGPAAKIGQGWGDVYQESRWKPRPKVPEGTSLTIADYYRDKIAPKPGREVTMPQQDASARVDGSHGDLDIRLPRLNVWPQGPRM